jgi:AcrR family transcriptional regulator
MLYCNSCCYFNRLQHIATMTTDRLVQRARIAEVTADLIAREGARATTVRRVAAELNCSTSIVTYYFSSKQELLVSAYTSLHDELYQKVAALLGRSSSDLVGLLLLMTAAEEVSFKRWRTYVSLWALATQDERWAARQRHDVEVAIAHIEGAIVARNGQMADLQARARDLNAFIHGISLQALMDNAAWPKERLRARIEAFVNNFLGPAAADR